MTGRKKMGASTISMQVVKLLEPKKRTYFNKLVEVVKAYKLESEFSKEEILKIYLNNVPYGWFLFITIDTPSPKKFLLRAVV